MIALVNPAFRKLSSVHSTLTVSAIFSWHPHAKRNNIAFPLIKYLGAHNLTVMS